MTRDELRNTMTRMNEHPDDIARWCSREVMWNGQPVTVSAPQPINPPSAEDGS